MVDDGGHPRKSSTFDIACRKQLIGKIDVPANPHWVAFDKNRAVKLGPHLRPERWWG